MCRHKTDLCGHAGLEQLILIGGVDDHVISHHTLVNGWVQSHQPDRARKVAFWIRVNTEFDRHALLNRAYVGFGHGRVDLHGVETLGDLKQGRRIKAGGNRLAEVNLAINDDAIDRRANDGVGKIGFFAIQLGLHLRHGRFGDIQVTGV